MSKTPVQTLQVISHGNVQGVGFRVATSDISRRFEVTGYVRNRSDGTVELVAQGEASTVQSFLTAIANRFTTKISQVVVTEASSDEEFESFEIRH